MRNSRFFQQKKKNIRGWWYGLSGKGARHQAWWPVWSLRFTWSRRVQIPRGCSLTFNMHSTHTNTHICIHTCIINLAKFNNSSMRYRWASWGLQLCYLWIFSTMHIHVWICIHLHIYIIEEVMSSHRGVFLYRFLFHNSQFLLPEWEY